MVNDAEIQNSIDMCRRIFWKYNDTVDVESIGVETAWIAAQTFDETRGAPFHAYHKLLCSRKIKSEIRLLNGVKRCSGCPTGSFDGALDRAREYDPDTVELEETVRQIESVSVNKKCVEVIWGIETVEECAQRTGLKRESIEVMVSYGRKKIWEALYGKRSKKRNSSPAGTVAAKDYGIEQSVVLCAAIGGESDPGASSNDGCTGTDRPHFELDGKEPGHEE